MSTSAYARIAKSVVKTLKRKGQTMYLIQRGASTYDPNTGLTMIPAPLRIAVFAVEIAGAQTEQPEQQVQSGNKTVYMEAIAPTRDPATYDALEIGGVLHEIITSTPLNPAGVAVLYTLRVREGG